MKTRLHFSRSILLMIALMSTWGALAQTSQTLTQNVCPGTQPYKVTPGNTANTFQWSISSGTSGVNWTISTPTLSNTNVEWANPLAQVTYTLTLTETDIITSCITVVSMDVTVNPLPANPTSGGNITECELLPIQTLLATATAPVGSTVVWYDAATGGSVVASPMRNTVGTVTYYAESVVTTSGCISLTRTPVVLTINPAPIAPISGGNITECELSPIQTLTATATAPVGSTVVWYTALTGGTVVASPTRNTVGSVTYYAESVVTLTGCSSLTRTAVVLTINPAPVAPISGGNITDCKQSPIQLLTATATAPVGSTVVWYSALTGGSVVASPVLNTVGTVTYYAESVVTLSGCTSLTRTPVVLIINNVPATSPIWHN